ncbi:MAG: 4-hydroxy-tetrahydrodipicolinate reductase [bacterium]
MADDTKIRVAVSGALGRMGRTTCEAVAGDDQMSLVAAVDPGSFPVEADRTQRERCFGSLTEALEAGNVDVVVDFTTPTVVRENILTCVNHRVPVVVGTTGLTAADLAEIEQEAATHDVPVLVAPNFAMGAVLMMQFARQAAQHFRACEIVELHHDRKLDAPSGTSRLTRLRIQEAWREAGYEREIPIHSVRLPGLVAHQEVIFGGLGETLTIRHDSLSRESFMPGVLLAVKRIGGLQGLIVGLENIL